MVADIFNRVKERARQYIDLQVKLLKLNVIGQSAKILGTLMFILICLFIFFCILIFTGFGMEEAFTDWGLSRAAAFFITRGFYFVLFIIAIMLRRSITNLFAGIFIRDMSGGDGEDVPKD